MALLLTLLVALAGAAYGAEQNPVKIKQIEYFFAQANNYARTKDYDEAIVLLDKAIAIDPNRMDVREFKILCLFETQEDDPKALAEAEKVLALPGGKNSQTYRLQGWILSRMNRLPEALQAVNKSIDLLTVFAKQKPLEGNAPLASLYSDRANIERKQQRFREAQKDLSMAIKLNPAAQDNFNRRAQVSVLLSDWQQVLADTAHVLSAKPSGIVFERRDAFLMRGKAYAALKDRKNATATYLLANRVCPDDRQLLSESLTYFESVNDKTNAEKMRKTLKAVDEDFTPIK